MYSRVRVRYHSPPHEDAGLAGLAAHTECAITPCRRTTDIAPHILLAVTTVATDGSDWGQRTVHETDIVQLPK